MMMMMMIMIMIIIIIIIIIIVLLEGILTTDQLVNNLKSFCGNIVQCHIHKSI